jgi:hypothetical protein
MRSVLKVEYLVVIFWICIRVISYTKLSRITASPDFFVGYRDRN